MQGALISPSHRTVTTVVNISIYMHLQTKLNDVGYGLSCRVIGIVITYTLLRIIKGTLKEPVCNI